MVTRSYLRFWLALFLKINSSETTSANVLEVNRFNYLNALFHFLWVLVIQWVAAATLKVTIEILRENIYLAQWVVGMM